MENSRGVKRDGGALGPESAVVFRTLPMQGSGKYEECRGKQVKGP